MSSRDESYPTPDAVLGALKAKGWYGSPEPSHGSPEPSREFVVKDGGDKKEFDSGMQRNLSKHRLRYSRVFDGPMLARWAEHLNKGAVIYPDGPDGSPNWMKADGMDEYRRFIESALSHFVDVLEGKRDEDHVAAVFFNLNGAEYVREKLEARGEFNIRPDRAWPRPEA